MCKLDHCSVSHSPQLFEQLFVVLPSSDVHFHFHSVELILSSYVIVAHVHSHVYSSSPQSTILFFLVLHPLVPLHSCPVGHVYEHACVVSVAQNQSLLVVGVAEDGVAPLGYEPVHSGSDHGQS